MDFDFPPQPVCGRFPRLCATVRLALDATLGAILWLLPVHGGGPGAPARAVRSVPGHRQHHLWADLRRALHLAH